MYVSMLPSTTCLLSLPIGLDPETDAYAAAYPNARTFSFGVDVSF